MTWILDDREFEALLARSEPERYEYLIKKAADTEHLWSLWTPAGWALSGHEEHKEMIPVWPHERFAAACATAAWQGYEPRSISIRDWLEKWIPGMLRDGRKISGFPLPSGRAVVVAPDRMREDLERELENYEPTT
jgi:hypothetical protein